MEVLFRSLVLAESLEDLDQLQRFRRAVVGGGNELIWQFGTLAQDADDCLFVGDSLLLSLADQLSFCLLRRLLSGSIFIF